MLGSGSLKELCLAVRILGSRDWPSVRRQWGQRVILMFSWTQLSVQGMFFDVTNYVNVNLKVNLRTIHMLQNIFGPQSPDMDCVLPHVVTKANSGKNTFLLTLLVFFVKRSEEHTSELQSR